MAAKRSPRTGRTGADHGGARKGAGRKPDILPPEVLARIGPMPDDRRPLEFSRWWLRWVGELAILHASTGRYKEMFLAMTKGLTSSMRGVPMDTIREAQRKLDEEEDDIKDDGGPKEIARTTNGQASRAVRRDAP